MYKTIFRTRLFDTKTLFLEIRIITNEPTLIRRFFEFQNKENVLPELPVRSAGEIGVYTGVFSQPGARMVIGWLAENDGHYEKWED